MLTGVLQAQELRLVRYYSDNMVLQRDKETVVRGSAPSGAKVTVSFAGQEKAGKADAAGQWAITLDPMPASAKGQKLAVTSSIGNQKTEIGNVLMSEFNGLTPGSLANRETFSLDQKPPEPSPGQWGDAGGSSGF